jgi:hypothetical protein
LVRPGDNVGDAALGISEACPAARHPRPSTVCVIAVHVARLELEDDPWRLVVEHRHGTHPHGAAAQNDCRGVLKAVG